MRIHLHFKTVLVMDELNMTHLYTLNKIVLRINCIIIVASFANDTSN